VTVSRSQSVGAHVRLKYATLVNFISRVISSLVNLLFIIIVIRRLTVEEFAIWTLIFKYVGYVLPFVVVYTYWLPRTIGRGVNTAKAGLLLAVSLGLGSTLIYLGLVYEVSVAFNHPFYILALAGLMVLEEYVFKCLSAISITHAPQYIGYSQLTLRIVQTLLAFLLVYLYRMGLYGAVLSVIAGRLAVLVLLFVLNRYIIESSRLDLNTVKLWVKRSWLPILTSFITTLATYDVLIVRVISGREEPIAYYGVIAAFLGLTVPALRITSALYSRLLARRDIRDFYEAYWISFMLIVPMVVGILVYSEPLIAIYSVKYLGAALALKVFALAMLPELLTRLLRTTLRGLETRDLEFSSDYGFELTETALFKVPILDLALTIVYLALVGLASTVITKAVLLVAVWGLVYLLRQTALIILFVRLLKKEFNVSLDYIALLRMIIKFVIASMGIVIVGFLFPVKPEVSIWMLMRGLAPMVALSALVYFSLLYVIDDKFKTLLKSSIKQLKRRGIIGD